MVAITFEKRFADDVAKGAKLQTVRRERKRPIVVGDRLQLYTGLRTKRARKLADAICTETAGVIIRRRDMLIRGRRLSAEDAEAFAQADGFDCYDTMAAWFAQKADLPFTGHAIKWRLADG